MSAIEETPFAELLDRLEADALGLRRRADELLELVSCLRMVAGPADVSGNSPVSEPALPNANGRARSLIQYDSLRESYAIGSRAVYLTAQEKAVMDFLRRNAPRFSSREEILALLRSATWHPKLGTVDVLISRLRKKFRNAGNVEDAIPYARGRGWTIAPGLLTGEPLDVAVAD